MLAQCSPDRTYAWKRFPKTENESKLVLSIHRVIQKVMNTDLQKSRGTFIAERNVGFVGSKDETHPHGTLTGWVKYSQQTEHCRLVWVGSRYWRLRRS